MAKYSTLVMDEDKDAPKKKRDNRFSTLKEDKDKDAGKGVWRTVRGRHVFIEEGKTLEQALGHKPGVENQKKIEDEGLKKTSSAPYLKQAEREAYQKKNPTTSAYEKQFNSLKKKNKLTPAERMELYKKSLKK